MRILFMGTPDFAVASLRRLVEDGHDVCGVFTQPDKPRNRGHKMAFSPVKEYAITQNIPVYQPLKMRDGEALSIVQSLAPELIVVAAYGKILPEDILHTPPYGSINVHSSVLPKYRGAAPINWAILNGETATGVTIMYMAKELDAGDIILCRETAIDPDEDALALTNRLDRSLSPLDFTKPARQLHDQVRGLIPWPCAVMTLDGKMVKVYRTAVGGDTAAAPGKILAAGKNGIDIACGDGKALRIPEVQAEGGKRMTAANYLCGHPVQVDA